MKISLSISEDWGLIGVVDENSNRLTPFEVDLLLEPGMYRKIYDSSKSGKLHPKWVSILEEHGYFLSEELYNQGVTEYYFESVYNNKL